MTERKAGNWLRGFQFYTQESECPDSFLNWVALATIAGATQRQVKIKWLYYDYYPNIYLMLVGPPGVHKSTAMKFGRGMLDTLQIPVSSESGSKEALLEQMIEKNKDKKPQRSAITIHSGDFMTFMQTSGPSMIEMLTDLYDCQDKWEYTTLKRGTRVIRNVFINMMAGTTPSWISETFNVAFTEQGWASRVLWVFEHDTRFKKAFATITREMNDMYIALLEDLVTISKISGEFQWTEDGIKWFKHWYEEELPKERLDYRLGGYLFRKPTHVIKVAMLLCLSETDQLLMNERYLQTSKLLLDNLEPKMSQAFSSVGRNPYANDLMRIYHDIEREGGMSEAQIRTVNLGSMEKEKLDSQLENLKLMGKIYIGIKNGAVWYYPRKEIIKP